jgi:hypothetical protein
VDLRGRRARLAWPLVAAHRPRLRASGRPRPAPKNDLSHFAGSSSARPAGFEPATSRSRGVSDCLLSHDFLPANGGIFGARSLRRSRAISAGLECVQATRAASWPIDVAKRCRGLYDPSRGGPDASYCARSASFATSRPVTLGRLFQHCGDVGPPAKAVDRLVEPAAPRHRRARPGGSAVGGAERAAPEAAQGRVDAGLDRRAVAGRRAAVGPGLLIGRALSRVR